MTTNNELKRLEDYFFGGLPIKLLLMIGEVFGKQKLILNSASDDSIKQSLWASPGRTT